MTFKTTKLRDAITFALVIGAGSSGVAFGQEAASGEAKAQGQADDHQEESAMKHRSYLTHG